MKSFIINYQNFDYKKDNENILQKWPTLITMYANMQIWEISLMYTDTFKNWCCHVTFTRPLTKSDWPKILQALLLFSYRRNRRSSKIEDFRKLHWVPPACVPPFPLNGALSLLLLQTSKDYTYPAICILWGWQRQSQKKKEKKMYVASSLPSVYC